MKLNHLIDELDRVGGPEMARRMRNVGLLLGTNPVLNPPEIQESWIAAITLGGASVDRAGVTLSLLIKQVTETHRLDIWLTDRFPELQGTLTSMLNARGGWNDNIAKLRLLLTTLGGRTDAMAQRDAQAWPAGTPPEVTASGLDPTLDVVTLGGGHFIVAYPHQLHLVEGTKVSKITMQQAQAHLIANEHPALVEASA